MHKISASLHRLVLFFRSSRAFPCILGLFFLETAWIALTGRYPMAFDEDFHLGIIRLYAQHLLPFWSAHPEGSDAFGAVARDPSYLYHFVLGYMYRGLSLITTNQTAIVLIFRFIDIVLFAFGLYLFRRLFLRMKAPESVINIALLCFVLIPVVPLMAAQLNYDNALFVLVAVAYLLAMQLADAWRDGQNWLLVFLQLLAVCMAASLVKYAFLPVFVAIVGFEAVMGVRYRTRHHYFKQDFLRQLRSWRRPGFIIASIFVVLLSVMWLERYAVNLAQYHTPVPDCGKVLSVAQCSSYGPWERDYVYAQQKQNFHPQPFSYLRDWLYGMWYRSFFAVDGPTTQFETRGPLLLPGLVGVIFPVVGLLAAIIAWRRLSDKYDKRMMWLLVSAAAIYAVSLFADGYKSYVRTGQAVAVNGRYLMMILLPLLVIAFLSLRELLQRRRLLQQVLVTVMLAALFMGGGALTYVLRSNGAWYWPAPIVKTTNRQVQKTLGPVIPGDKAPDHFLPFHVWPPQA